MAVEPRCMAGLAKADPRLTRPAVLWAAGLFLAGLIFLLFPVGSTASYDGKFTATGDSGWELCGLGVTEAFVTPNGADDPRREQKMDCAAKARSQLGWGLLFLVLAVPRASSHWRRHQDLSPLSASEIRKSLPTHR